MRSFIYSCELSPVSRTLDNVLCRRTPDTNGVRIGVKRTMQIGADVPDLCIRIQSCARMIHVALA